MQVLNELFDVCHISHYLNENYNISILGSTNIIIDSIYVREQSQSWKVVSYQLPANFTVSAAYRSDNNLVRIQSVQLAENLSLIHI